MQRQEIRIKLEGVLGIVGIDFCRCLERYKGFSALGSGQKDLVDMVTG